LEKKSKVNAYINKDIYTTIPRAQKRYLKVKVNYDGPLEAPITKNEVIGKLNIFFKDENIGSYDLYASEDVKKQNFLSRIISSINFLIWGDA